MYHASEGPQGVLRTSLPGPGRSLFPPSMVDDKPCRSGPKRAAKPIRDHVMQVTGSANRDLKDFIHDCKDGQDDQGRAPFRRPPPKAE